MSLIADWLTRECCSSLSLPILSGSSLYLCMSIYFHFYCLYTFFPRFNSVLSFSPLHFSFVFLSSLLSSLPPSRSPSFFPPFSFLLTSPPIPLSSLPPSLPASAFSSSFPHLPAPSIPRLCLPKELFIQHKLTIHKASEVKVISRNASGCCKIMFTSAGLAIVALKALFAGGYLYIYFFFMALQVSLCNAAHFFFNPVHCLCVNLCLLTLIMMLVVDSITCVIG